MLVTWQSGYTPLKTKKLKVFEAHTGPGTRWTEGGRRRRQPFDDFGDERETGTKSLNSNCELLYGTLESVPTTEEPMLLQFPCTSPELAGARRGLSPRLWPGLASRLCTPVTSMPTKTDVTARLARLVTSLVFMANRFEGSIPAVRYI